MKCISCGIEINSSFKHAIQKNECPSCGNFILSEELLGLIEDIKKTIMGEATLREETAQKIATSIVSKYDIFLKNGETKLIQVIEEKEIPEENIKMAPPSSYKQINKQEPKIIEVSQMLKDGISEEEREKIMTEVVKERYNMVDQMPLKGIDDFQPTGDLNVDMNLVLGNKEGNKVLTGMVNEATANPVLEQERQARLLKQQQMLKSGSGKIHRG